MVLLLIGIAIGILLVIILVIKAYKTSSTAIIGMDIRCKKCGFETNGMSCPKCKQKSQSFGV
jgi:predicted Zn-ribbon and HTH transcriptional regulator